MQPWASAGTLAFIMVHHRDSPVERVSRQTVCVQGGGGRMNGYPYHKYLEIDYQHGG